MLVSNHLETYILSSFKLLLSVSLTVQLCLTFYIFYRHPTMLSFLLPYPRVD